MNERKPDEDAPAPASDDDLVDEASMDSFPASDPPSFWARDPDRKR